MQLKIYIIVIVLKIIIILLLMMSISGFLTLKNRLSKNINITILMKEILARKAGNHVTMR